MSLAAIPVYLLMRRPGAGTWPLLRTLANDPRVPEALQDPQNWPEGVRREYGEDKGASAHRAHRARLVNAFRKLKEEIEELAGRPLNIDSPKQLAELLFRELKLPMLKRTKTGPSTDVEVLDKLAAEHKVPKLVLEYRSLVKLKNTYLDNLGEYLNPKTHRIHGSFNQTGAATGRFVEAGEETTFAKRVVRQRAVSRPHNHAANRTRGGNLTRAG